MRACAGELAGAVEDEQGAQPTRGPGLPAHCLHHARPHGPVLRCVLAPVMSGLATLH